MISIIAEFCQNHNGDYKLLSQMVKTAAKCGATHAKIQSISPKNLTFRPEFEEGVIVDGTRMAIKRPFSNEFERLSKLELSDDECIKFINLCKENNLIPLTTCFVRSDVDKLYDLGFRTIKVASYDCASFPLLRELSEKFEEIFISTGATFDNEIEYAAKILQGCKFHFLHCITNYPTPLNEMNLNRINWLKKFTPNIGFSDHSLVERDGIIASKAALALGANVIERHFTILGPNETKDGPVSINSEQLNELVEFSKLSTNDQLKSLDYELKNWAIMKGSELRDLTREELLNRNYYRGRFASIRSQCPTNKNQMINNWEDTPLK